MLHEPSPKILIVTPPPSHLGLHYDAGTVRIVLTQ
jgi:hypothetical protein